MDDIFGKKKDSTPILDLSNAIAHSSEEFKKLFEKVPDFKIRAEKIKANEVKVKTRHLSFKMDKKERKLLEEQYQMADPIPMEMRLLKIEDLAKVPIDWKMLTNNRPKNKIDEEYFNRLVELRKAELRSIERERRIALFRSDIKKTKNKSGIIEVRALSCAFCGEEFCNGKSCKEFLYDSFTHIEIPSTAGDPKPSSNHTQAMIDAIPIRKRKATKRRKRAKSSSNVDGKESGEGKKDKRRSKSDTGKRKKRGKSVG